MRRAVVLLGLFATACGGASGRAQVPEGAMVHGAECALAGSGEIDGQVFAAASGEDTIASVQGFRVGIATRLLAPAGSTRAQVHLRADVLGPTMHLDGWFELGDLPIHARHDIEIIEEHAWIAKGAPLSVIAGERERVRVMVTPYHQGFDDLSTETTCAALAMGSEVRTRDLGHAPANGALFHPRRDTLPLSDVAGKSLRTLRARHFEVVTLQLLEQHSGMGHVKYDDWLRIDGWVKMSDLAAGAGADCDDCRGPGVRDRVDVCFGHPIADFEAQGCISHGEQLVTAKRDAKVRRSASDDAAPIGSVDRGARVYIVNRQAPWAQIAPSTGAFFSPDRLGFWVKLADLE